MILLAKLNQIREINPEEYIIVLARYIKASLTPEQVQSLISKLSK